MKFRYLMMSLLAVSALAVGCKEEAEDLGLPQITVAGDGITFDATTKKASLEAGADLSSYKTTVTANRPWTVDVTYGSAEKDWIAATPDHGNASSRPQEVLLTLLPNEGRDRTATVKYNIGYDYKTLTIKQKGALGSVEDATLYANNFDKETVTSNTFLDAGSQWRNETGTGIANVSYEFKGMSARTSGTSTSSDHYTASGANNIFFGADSHFQIRNIALGGQTNLRLSFGSVRNQYGETENVFDHEEFKVYAAVDGAKWKELTYTFPGGVDPDGTWEIATADFTLPSGTEALYLYFQANLASSYRIDDLSLVIKDGEAGTPIDFSDGITLATDGNTTDGGGTQPDEPTDVKAVTVSEFNAAPESDTQVYELTGRISGSINTTYGNFDLVDDSGSVYVYGLTATYLGYGATNDKSYASLGLNAGDEIKIRGYRGSYGEKIEVMYAWFIEILSSGSTDPGTDPGTGSKFESDAAFVCSANDSGNSSYTLDDASGSTTFNGERATGFKLGTSSKIGKFTSSAVGVEGDYTLSFYGVAWKGQKGTVKISVNGGGSVEGSDTFELRSNDGASNNVPFTITLDETADHYSVVLKGLTKTSTVTFETVTNAYRAVVAGVHLTEGTDGGSTDPGTGGDEPAEVKAVTVSEFNAAPESSTQVYELTGRISGSINTTYGNFDLVDDSGSVYVYGLTATELGYGATNDKSYASLNLNAGDEIKIRGYRGSYGDKIEVLYAWFIERLSSGSTDPGTGGDEPTEVKAVTVSEFNAAPESSTQVYELTGRISGSINTTYGNFDLVDDSGSVYVYGLTATELGYGATNDKSYASLGLNAGDEIKIRGYRGSYGDKIEVLYAWFIEILSSGSTDPGTDPGTGSKFESDAIFVCSADNSSNASYTLGATKINGQSSSGFKLGTASKIGKFTSSAVGVEGDYMLSFYGVAWKGQKGSVKISVSGGGSVEGSDTFELRSNDGATGNPAFTITLDETADHYSVVLKGLTKTSTVTFETVTDAYRAVVAGVHLTDNGTTGGGSTDPGTGEETTSSFDFSAQGYENGSEVTSVTFDDVTVTFDKGSNSNTPKYYSSGTSVRVYGGGTITVEAGGKTITGIKFTYGTSDQTNEITADSGTFSTDTWTGSTTSVTFTISGTSGHRRVKAIEVSYK